MSIKQFCNQYVDIQQSEMPNYSVYQRNLGKLPVGVIAYQGETRTRNNPIVIDKYDMNINEKYNQFSSQSLNAVSQSGVFLAAQQQQMPNFDIEYKGTRSLFNSKYKKPSNSINQQLDQLKTQPIQQLRNSALITSSIQTRVNTQSSITESAYPSASENHLVISRMIASPPQMKSNILHESNLNRQSFAHYYNPQHTQYDRLKSNNNNHSFDMSRIKSGLLDERPKVFESRAMYSDGNNSMSNYSKYLLNSGDRKVFTSEEKSHLTSKHMYTKPHFVSGFTLDNNQDNYAHNIPNHDNYSIKDQDIKYLQTPNFQHTNNTYSSFDKPEVFKRKNILF